MSDSPDRADTGGTGVGLGDVLAGKYRVERVLGVGGMGVVVAARHLALDERVALKLLRPDALRHGDAIARFIREARAAAKIKSEHVARVSDVGALDNGAPYMVMEYLEGRDLSAWLEHRGRMDIEQAVDFVIQASEAIAEAHGLGIIHRDLKPANLFCVQSVDGKLSIKVLDFGISKFTSPGAPAQEMTKTSQAMGSPYYMSPEQMKDTKSVDTRTDIWALGVIVFELVTGCHAFVADTILELAIKVATESPESMRNLRPDVPPLLEAIVAKCLEKERRLRYANVAELALALLPFGSSRSTAVVDRIVGIVGRDSLRDRHALPEEIALAAPLSVSSRAALALAETTSAPTAAMARSGPFLVVALVIACFGTLLVVQRRSTVATEESWSATAPPESATAASPSDSVPIALAPDAGDPSAPWTVKSSQAPRPTSHSVRRPVLAPPSADECNPPYTIDDQGRKHFKHDCYAKP